MTFTLLHLFQVRSRKQTLPRVSNIMDFNRDFYTLQNRAWEMRIFQCAEKMDTPWKFNVAPFKHHFSVGMLNFWGVIDDSNWQEENGTNQSHSKKRIQTNHFAISTCKKPPHKTKHVFLAFWSSHVTNLTTQNLPQPFHHLNVILTAPRNVHNPCLQRKWLSIQTSGMMEASESEPSNRPAVRSCTAVVGCGFHPWKFSHFEAQKWSFASNDFPFQWGDC